MIRHTNIILNGIDFQMPSITIGSTFYGTKINREEAFRMMDYYFEQGGNWFDTARVYGVGLIPENLRKPEYMDSEEVIGEWIRVRGVRDRVTVITKGAHWDLETKRKRVTAESIRSDMEMSLKKLGISGVDIYLLHRDDESVPVPEIMPVLHDFVKTDKTRVIGCSNWNVRRILEANKYAEQHDLTPFSISEMKWSYVYPDAGSSEGFPDMHLNPEQYEMYKKNQMPVMAYSSQAKGFFLKADKFGFETDRLGSAAGFLNDENMKRANKVIQLSKEHRISISAAAFSYLWSREIPVTALVGCSTLSQLKESLEDADFNAFGLQNFFKDRD